MQIDLMVNSFAADFARVATLQYTNSVGGARMRWLGVNEGHHELSHKPDSDEKSQEKLTKINKWYCEQLAYLAKRLAETPEPGGGGSLLDNTLIVWTNELGKGNSHTLDNIPFVLVGNGLDFRMGRSLKYTKVPHNRLLLSLAHGMGHRIERFGNPDFCGDGDPAEPDLSNAVTGGCERPRRRTKGTPMRAGALPRVLAVLGSALALTTAVGFSEEPAAPARPRAFVDGTGPGWRELGEADFVNVNCEPDTWTWKDGVVHCTGTPIGVIRTVKPVDQLRAGRPVAAPSLGREFGHLRLGPAAAMEDLKPNALPKGGIEVQILDHGFAEQYEKRPARRGPSSRPTATSSPWGRRR